MVNIKFYYALKHAHFQQNIETQDGDARYIMIKKSNKSNMTQSPEEADELIDEFGKPDDVIYEGSNKVLVFKTKKYKITCIRKFTISNNGVISWFNSRNCF